MRQRRKTLPLCSRLGKPQGFGEFVGLEADDDRAVNDRHGYCPNAHLPQFIHRFRIIRDIPLNKSDPPLRKPRFLLLAGTSALCRVDNDLLCHRQLTSTENFAPLSITQ